MPDWALMVTVGSILIILGILLVAIGMMRSVTGTAEHEKEKRVKGGGVIFIGPIPVVFGTDKRFALIAMILAVVLMLLAILFLK